MRNERQINVKPFQLPVIARAGKAFSGLLRYFSPWQSPSTEHDVKIPNETITMLTHNSPLTPTAPTSAKSYGGQAIARTLRQAQDDMLIKKTPPLPLPSTCSGQALFRREVLCFLLLITILLLTSNQTTAQTPYTGGSGDGHAMGELVLRNVSVNELTTNDGYNIYPSQTKVGEAIYITSPVAGELQIIDITGRIIHTQTIEQPVQQLPVVVTQAGLCIGIIRTQAGTFTQKIIVVE